jgi:hypothetical protein
MTDKTSQKLICGCRAQCKGFQKLVSLSTFNRHRKYRDAESFSTEFQGFLASSSALMGSQLEATGSNSTTLPTLYDIGGNEAGADWEMEDSMISTSTSVSDI